MGRESDTREGPGPSSRSPGCGRPYFSSLVPCPRQSARSARAAAAASLLFTTSIVQETTACNQQADKPFFAFAFGLSATTIRKGRGTQAHRFEEADTALLPLGKNKRTPALAQQFGPCLPHFSTNLALGERDWRPTARSPHILELPDRQ